MFTWVFYSNNEDSMLLYIREIIFMTNLAKIPHSGHMAGEWMLNTEIKI